MHTGLIAYMDKWPTKVYMNMHEQVAKSLVYIWHYFLDKNIFTAFSPILVVLHCYKRPDTFQVWIVHDMPQMTYNTYLKRVRTFITLLNTQNC